MVNQLQVQYKVEVEYVHLDKYGHIDYNHLEDLLSKSSNVLVSLMHINNEIGNILDIKRVGELCRANNALFHSDTVQSVGHYPMDLQTLEVDFMAVSAHKFHGPKGVGFAFIRKSSGLKPLIFGGEQERGLRAGTESVHNIVGLEKALQISYDNLTEESDYIKGLKGYFMDEILKAIPTIEFNGHCASFDESTYTLVNVNLPVSPEKAPMLLFQLDLKGIACSKGSACQSGSQKGSHVLNQVQNEAQKQKPSLRFSFSKFNTKADIDYVVKELAQIVNL
jgi:cysteine desulfurase